MSTPPVILAVLQPDALRTAALARALALAQSSGGSLHLCCFVHDALIEAATVRPNPEIGQGARLALLEEQMVAVRALAAELAAQATPMRYDVVWASVAHEAIIAKALLIGADYVVKDLGHPNRLSRALFTPLDWKLARLLPCALMLVRAQSPASPRRILAAVDMLAEEGGADGLNASVLRAARRVAELVGGSLELASVAPAPPGPGPAGGVADGLDVVLARHGEAFSNFAVQHGIPPQQCHRLSGVPVGCLTDLVKERGIDLAVVGNVYRNAVQRMLLGSTVEELLRQLDCDLMVVKRPDFHEVLARHLDLARVQRELSSMPHAHSARELA
ncbi:MAG TPA: universal stress protein [Nevskia sp.]|nr:universal stress protein [Nevskia sp.]